MVKSKSLYQIEKLFFNRTNKNSNYKIGDFDAKDKFDFGAKM